MNSKRSALISSLFLIAGCAVATPEDAESLGTNEAPLCPLNNPDCGPQEPAEPGGNKPPAPFTSKPDAAFQLSPCVGSALENDIIQAVKKSAPGADVRGQCKNNKEQFGVWLKAVKGVDDGPARQRGLDKVSILTGSETFGVFLDANAIRSKVDDVWNNTPHNMNHDGKAASGPIHLTGYDLQFNNFPLPQVVTSIAGYDDAPWPDLYFTVRSTDTLTLKNGQVSCSSNVVLDKEDSALNALAAVFMVLMPVPLGGIFAAEAAIVGGVEAPGGLSGAGVACPAARLIPSEIMIKNKLKVLFNYSRLAVNNTGITAAGGFSVVPRSPKVAISGPSTIKVELDMAAKGTYKIVPDDLLPPLTVSWSSPSGTVGSKTAQSTVVTYNLNNPHLNQIFQKGVSVTVTDSEGLTASATKATKVQVVMDAQLPPVCLHKPDLPQCNP